MANVGSTAQNLDAAWNRDAVHVRTVAEQVVLDSRERSALTLEQYAQLVISFAESAKEQDRRRAIRRRVDLVRDAWGPLVKAAFENWTTPSVQDAVLGTSRDHLDLSRNPAKNIWRELAATYNASPTRSTPTNQADGERYLELLKDTQFDLFWQQVELLLNACNEVLIWPDVIKRGDNKIIKHRYACGDNAVIVTTEDDPTEIECVLIIDKYRDLSGRKLSKYRLWTDDWHAEFKVDAQNRIERVGYVDPELAPEDDTGSANPYKKIPMYLVRLYPWGDCIWDQTSSEDLVDLTIHGGIERAFYRYSQKMSGFKQLLASGDSVEKPPQQLMDPGAIATVEGHGVSTQIIDWQLDMRSKLECMMMDELAAAAAHGINPERYKQSGNYQSGSAAALSERGLAKQYERRKVILALAEKRYKANACVVWAAHKIENPPDPEIELDVRYGPMSYPEDPASQVAVEKEELSMALESHITLLLRRHPGWTEEQAKEFLTDNMETIAWVSEQKAKRNVANDPTNESLSAEEYGKTGPLVRDQKPPEAGAPPAKQMSETEDEDVSRT